jgi:hypothetical protein
MVGYAEDKAKAGVAFSELAPGYAIKPGTPIPNPQPIFPRLENL